jgi:hypothetical protein
MLYGYDIFKMARMYERMEFATHCAANMLQNSSKNRENKLITLNDIKNACASAYLTVYNGNTIYDANRTGGGNIPWAHCFVYCIKGMSGEKASILWLVTVWITGGIAQCSSNAADHPRSSVRFLKNASPAQIYKELKIKKDEVKILVELTNVCKISTASDAFGFLMMNPKYSSIYGDSGHYFTSVIIFTPNPGLFSETQPQ